ncbi:Na+/H+ antiporter NhaC family protein [Pseudalkalibacillus decolorationis]|uniref:Na+/H+ antiporter NhaC family protein n=1 Tax=Pseudalkalibacillus decolorationis TaxID=163879 RepID=UPI00214968D9|nr:Na+/H+ antiporter NhaC family protein [Pseudalkalibacillus decolorationis]
MEGSVFSLLLPLIVMVLCFTTRRVILSLGIGVVIGALMYTNFNVIFAAGYLFGQLKALFIEETDTGWVLNTWNIYLIVFTILLGFFSSITHVMGGNKSFGGWVQSLLKTRVGAQLSSAILGVIIFIDDYFSCIVVGSISRSITDRFKISRAKLAYIIDSTATPVSVLVPISSWGAFMVGLIGTTMEDAGITGHSSFNAFMLTVPMNFYCIFAILMVFVVIINKINIGSMKTHELRAQTTGELVDPKRKHNSSGEKELPESDKGNVRDLVVPFVVLIITTFSALVITAIPGIKGAGEAVTFLAIFEYTKLVESLSIGGLAGFLVATGFFFSKKMPMLQLFQAMWHGFKSMLPAIMILLLAFTTAEIIGDLKMGELLAGLISSNVSLFLLPALIFIISIIIDFAIATAWGTWAILFPIIGQISVATDVDLFLPMVAAAIAGSIFGDHCSPISDSTILSSIGSGSNHMDHVITQLPYGLIVAGVSFIGYIILGITQSIWMGFFATTAIFIFVCYALKRFYNIRANTVKTDAAAAKE